MRLQPGRRADAQDMFLAGQEARVSAVHVDLDGETHVAVTLVDDPAADLHDWYGRYLYFAPDELEPLAGAATGRTIRPARGEPVMRALGMLTTLLLGGRGWRGPSSSASARCPDVKRYLEMRRM